MNRLFAASFMGIILSACSSPQPDYFVANLTEEDAFNNCQQAIKKGLKKPDSMDAETDTAKYSQSTDQQSHELSFEYYAENDVGGMIRNLAICKFDDNGNLIESRFERNIKKPA